MNRLAHYSRYALCREDERLGSGDILYLFLSDFLSYRTIRITDV